MKKCQTLKKQTTALKEKKEQAWYYKTIISLAGFELSVLELWVGCCTDVLSSLANKKLFKIQSFWKNEKRNHSFKREKKSMAWYNKTILSLAGFKLSVLKLWVGVAPPSYHHWTTRLFKIQNFWKKWKTLKKQTTTLKEKNRRPDIIRLLYLLRDLSSLS